jgi:hypothetical protein
MIDGYPSISIPKCPYLINILLHEDRILVLLTFPQISSSQILWYVASGTVSWLLTIARWSM